MTQGKEDEVGEERSLFGLFKRARQKRRTSQGEDKRRRRRKSLLRIVHARGAIPNEMGPAPCRTTPAFTNQPTRPNQEEEVIQNRTRTRRRRRRMDFNRSGCRWERFSLQSHKASPRSGTVVVEEAALVRAGESTSAVHRGFLQTRRGGVCVCVPARCAHRLDQSKQRPARSRTEHMSLLIGPRDVGRERIA